MAGEIGMQVNEKKTQLLCISADTSSTITSYIRSNDGEIVSGESLKILGFFFDSNPNAICHVNHVIGSFYNKLWVLRFLKRSGMDREGLIKVYCTVIRAAVEYCSVVYDSLIPTYLSDKLEQIQRQCMKIIYGVGMDYGKLIRDGTLETLKSRRDVAVLKFAQKASNSPRFGPKWFPKKVSERANRPGTGRKYEERTCRTERSRNNPIQKMVRVLNENEKN